MFESNKLASTFSRRIGAAARMAMEDITSGRAQQEPAITDRLIAYIQSEIRRENRRGFSWSAMTLTDRGRNSQEKKYGADFVGSLSIALEGFHARKGFLAQAKKVEPNQSYSAKEYENLKGQCEDMLRLSPASYVFLYSSVDGFSVLPAISVLAARNCNPHELTTKPIQKFFGEHFECFIGDPKVSLAEIETLDQLYEEYQARTGFHIKIADKQNQAEILRDLFS